MKEAGPNDLGDRTKQFGIRVIKLVRALPHTLDAKTVGSQLIRSGTSVGANYRAACRARSKREFIAKLGIVQEEADETEYWLELIIETNMLPARKVDPLRQEAAELTAIIAQSIKTARSRQ